MLARLQKSMKEKDHGFTLIELLVVIVIIGILAAIAIPLFLNQRKKGVDSSMKSDVKSVATSVETWLVDNPTSAVPDSNVSTAPLGGFTPSSGNTLRVYPRSDRGAYCIQVQNAGSSDPGGYVRYESAGGLVAGFTEDCIPG
jgi:prepilin-type N-terminal cleavage/methylation domain-containing protein